MRRRPDRKMGCLELAVVAFALFVAFQFIVLGSRVVGELVALAGTLIRWLGMGLAGALSLVVLTALVMGIGYGLKKAAAKFLRPPATADARHAPPVAHSRQAQQWQRGIRTTVGRLRKHNWLSKQDARRYRQSVDMAIERIRSLEHDIKTLRALPGSLELADELEKVAATLVGRLERTHHALARLLAESALERAPIVDAKLREATEELESLVAALAEVGAASAPSAMTTVPAAEEAPRPKEAATEETWV
ncbi:MAG: hypothetical protein FJX75_15470 [Armatimonadetes bacterium]|nr:hypothetical protein [Armatimonadota bacterium]